MPNDILNKRISSVVGQQETVSAPERSKFQQLWNEYAPNVVQDAVSHVREGLLGFDSSRMSMADPSRQESVADVFKRRGIVGTLVPFGFGKTQENKIFERQKGLVMNGVDEGEAYNLAVQHTQLKEQERYVDRIFDSMDESKIDKDSPVYEGYLQRKQARDSFKPTKEQQDALDAVEFEENLDKVFGALDFFAVGKIAKAPLREGVGRIASSKKANEIVDIVKEQIPDIPDVVAKRIGYRTQNVSRQNRIAEIMEEETAELFGGPRVGPEQKLLRVVKDMEFSRTELEDIYSAERAKRAAQVGKIQGKAPTEAGHYQALKALKGPLNESEIMREQGIRDLFTQDDIDALFMKVGQHERLLPLEKVSANDGLLKVLRGEELPQQRQLELLEDVFGPELVESLVSKRPLWDKAKDGIVSALNLARLPLTIFDHSAVFNQAVMLSLSASRIGMTADALKDSFKFAFSQRQMDNWSQSLRESPDFRRMEEDGLFVADTGRRASARLSEREELFQENLSKHIPVFGQAVKVSQRAYTGFLNKVRIDTYRQLIRQAEKQGDTSAATRKGIASFVNAASGRGGLGKLEGAAKELNTIFFAPRLQTARLTLMNPAWYAKQTPFVRKQALKHMAEFTAINGSILTMAKMAGADVELDPRSSDFGKIRIGDTRIDTWGGFQQWARFFYQNVGSYIASGFDSPQRKTLSTGEIIPINPVQEAARFARGKLSPGVSIPIDQLVGKNVVGEEVTLKNTLHNQLMPLYLQDMQEVMAEHGPGGLLWAGPLGFFGIRISAFDQVNPAVEKKLREMGLMQGKSRKDELLEKYNVGGNESSDRLKELREKYGI